jgi:transposase-like protein
MSHYVPLPGLTPLCRFSVPLLLRPRLAAAREEGRIGGRRKKLDATKRREIAESVITSRKSAAEMARLYGVSQPTVSRIVAAHRLESP